MLIMLSKRTLWVALRFLLRVSPSPPVVGVLETCKPFACAFGLRWRLGFVLFSPAFLSAIVLTLSLERLIPADPQQKIFSPGFSQDIVWLFYERIFHLLVFITYVDWLRRIYAEHLDFLTIETVGTWPAPIRFVIGVLLLDLLKGSYASAIDDQLTTRALVHAVVDLKPAHRDRVR